ncbi:hypothetical protein [Thermomonospora sp. CIF 1]|uniref:hypothetical protein n=1 Tax=Thermomonospora sp. CIF 1 TaxID=1916083 RepID=UPI00257E91D6|nr:hypothetical protein [Thermomonospora sp. CIF 1]
MKPTVAFAALAAGLAVGVARRMKARATGRAPCGDDAGRWLTVTVNRPPELLSKHLPEPLARLRNSIELRIQTAPGGRGAEVAARPRNGLSAAGGPQEARQAVRTALREAKALAETGEVLLPDEPAAARPVRPETVTAHAAGEGRR